MSEGTIKFACECGKAYKVPADFAGKRVKCKQCGEKVTVPSESEAVSSTRAAAVSQRSVVSSERLPKAPASAPAPKKPAQPRRPGSDTEVIEVPDIAPEMKVYQKKRDDDMKRGDGKLVLFEDKKPLKSFRLDKDPKVVGRGEKCAIRIDQPTVSKEHIKIEYQMGMFTATDQQSTNGLVVNGKKIRRAGLKDGDVIQLGDAIMRIDCAK